MRPTFIALGEAEHRGTKYSIIMTARDIGALRRITTKLAETEARSEFLKRMCKKKIGLREKRRVLA